MSFPSCSINQIIIMTVIKGFLWNISQILPPRALQKQQSHRILKQFLVLYFNCPYCAISFILIPQLQFFFL